LDSGGWLVKHASLDIFGFSGNRARR
jgi:hypothetical protein